MHILAKNLFFWASGLGLALLAPYSPAKAQAIPKNFLSNGSFESDGNSDSEADSWHSYRDIRDAAVDPKISWILAGGASSGDAYLRVSKRGGERAFSVSGTVKSDVISVLQTKPDASLVLSGEIRGADLSGRAYIILLLFGRAVEAKHERFISNVVTKPIVSATTGWTRVEATLRPSDVLPPGEVLTRVEVSLAVESNTGHADFDAISLTIAD